MHRLHPLIVVVDVFGNVFDFPSGGQYMVTMVT